MAKLASKYSLNPVVLHEYQIVNSKKNTMWEILCSTTSGGLKGHRKFPEAFAEEFDNDILQLQKLISLL